MSVSKERAKELGWTQQHVDAFDNIIYGPPGSSLIEAIQANNSESLNTLVPSPTNSEINDARDNWFSSIQDIIGPSADYIKNNFDIPGSVIGALYGEKYGGKIGHPIKGMIAGSAVGAFGGDLSSGFFSEGEDLKTIQPYLNALETGLTTGVLDFATLGIIKFSKPLVNKAGKL